MGCPCKNKKIAAKKVHKSSDLIKLNGQTLTKQQLRELLKKRKQNG